MDLTSFPKDFRETDVKAIISFVLTGKFCQLVCVPGGGKATLLKLIAINENLQKHHLGAKFASTRTIYLDLHELQSFERTQIEKFLLLAIDEGAKVESEPILLTKQLNRAFATLIEKNFNVIFLLDHFDEFQNRLPSSFFQQLKAFRTLNKYKFGTVFGTRRDLKELVDPQILQNFYDFFTDNTLYLKIYDEKATQVMFSQIEQAFGQKLSQEQRKSIIDLTSGHAKLTKVLAETLLREKTTLDPKTLPQKPIVKEALSELWLFLTAQEQHCLKQITQKKKVEKDEVLGNLIKFDLIKDDGFSFTIPLFELFVQGIIPNVVQEKITFDPNSKDIMKGSNVISELLSHQEYRLLRFLVENEGKIIERGEIISAVWPDAQVQEGISDEAIDQMVFRLRKKIEDEPNSPTHIITVKGRGLRFQS